MDLTPKNPFSPWAPHNAQPPEGKAGLPPPFGNILTGGGQPQLCHEGCHKTTPEGPRGLPGPQPRPRARPLPWQPRPVAQRACALRGRAHAQWAGGGPDGCHGDGVALRGRSAAAAMSSERGPALPFLPGCAFRDPTVSTAAW